MHQIHAKCEKNIKVVYPLKIRPLAKIDNFAFKNSNIIIKGLFWKRKDYSTWKKFETQKNNLINKFYFWPNFFSYRFLQNCKKLCDSNKSWIIFSEKRFPTTSPFLIFKYKFFNGWNNLKNIFQYDIFINKLLNLIIIYSISKIGNGKVVGNLFFEKVICNFFKSHNFLKFGKKR